MIYKPKKGKRKYGFWKKGKKKYWITDKKQLDIATQKIIESRKVMTNLRDQKKGGVESNKINIGVYIKSKINVSFDVSNKKKL